MALMAMPAVSRADPNASNDARRADYPDSLDGPREPANLLPRVDERREQLDSVFPVSPLGWLRDATGKGKDRLYDATGLKVAAVFAHVFQGISNAISHEDNWGAATTADLLGAWHLISRDKPTVGQVVAHGQGRWDYGTTGPEDLGAVSLASGIGTADTFSKYSPAFLLRNLYWRHGSEQAGWVYRLGKITPDGLLNASVHLDSQTTFLPSGATGPFAIALPDSGLGAVGAWYFNERVALAGLISDANADRFNWGDIEEGDLFYAAELQVKVLPRTSKAPYSKLTLWRTNGTDGGKARNAMAGPSGWGIFFMHQQELTADGRAIGILRYGKSFNDSAIYEQQAGVHLLLKEPRLLTRLENDVVGAAFNWAKLPFSDARSEYNVEVFYRFPLFPSVDVTFSYQSVIHPALTRDVDHASVFSLRIRSAF